MTLMEGGAMNPPVVMVQVADMGVTSVDATRCLKDTRGMHDAMPRLAAGGGTLS